MRGAPRKARGAARKIALALLLLAGGIAGRAFGPNVQHVAARAPHPPAAPVSERAVTLPDGRPLSGRVHVEEAPNTLPALRAEVPWSVPQALYGWGSMRLFAHPRENELTVSTIVDAPSSSARWSATCEVSMIVDGTAVPVRASYVGAPMHGGVYDAMRMELPIETVRAMAGAREVRGTICGDAFVLDGSQRATIADFVHHFDLLARPDRMPHATPAQTGPHQDCMPDVCDEGWQDNG